MEKTDMWMKSCLWRENPQRFYISERFFWLKSVLKPKITSRTGQKVTYHSRIGSEITIIRGAFRKSNDAQDHKQRSQTVLHVSLVYRRPRLIFREGFSGSSRSFFNRLTAKSDQSCNWLSCGDIYLSDEIWSVRDDDTVWTLNADVV